ncbi:MAG: hypothetical protein QM796_18760 [Chthoniobacteraceae bacterium]
MSAATNSINTPEPTKDFFAYVPVAASTIIYVGTLVALSGGNAVPASDSAGLRVLGRCEGQSEVYNDNLAGTDANNSTGNAGDVKINVKRGAFAFNNSTADAVDTTCLGRIVYVEDDNTVNKTGGTNKVKAGLFLGFHLGDATLPIVDTRFAGLLVTPATVATANASDLTSAEALANALKTAFNGLSGI